MVQNLFDPRRLNPLLALLVLAVVIAHAAGLRAPWGAEAPGHNGAGPQAVVGVDPVVLAQIAEAQRLVHVVRAHLVAAVTAPDADTSSRHLAQAAAAVAASERVVRQLAALEDTPRDSLMAQLTLTQARLAVEGVAPVAAALRGGNGEAARRIVLERSIERLAVHEDVLHVVFERYHERMAAGYRRAQTAAEHAYLAALLACVLVIAAGAAYTLYMRRRIVGPLALLGHVMRVINEDHDYTHRAHVFGHPAVVRMAGAFDDMMSGIQASFERVAGAAPAASAVATDAIAVASTPNSGSVERMPPPAQIQSAAHADSTADRYAA